MKFQVCMIKSVQSYTSNNHSFVAFGIVRLQQTSCKPRKPNTEFVALIVARPFPPPVFDRLQHANTDQRQEVERPGNEADSLHCRPPAQLCNDSCF